MDRGRRQFQPGTASSGDLRPKGEGIKRGSPRTRRVPPVVCPALAPSMQYPELSPIVSTQAADMSVVHTLVPALNLFSNRHGHTGPCMERLTGDWISPTPGGILQYGGPSGRGTSTRQRRRRRDPRLGCLARIQPLIRYVGHLVRRVFVLTKKAWETRPQQCHAGNYVSICRLHGPRLPRPLAPESRAVVFKLSLTSETEVQRALFVPVGCLPAPWGPICSGQDA